MRRSSRTRWAFPTTSVEVNEADTAFVPDSGPTVASRTCMIVGKLLERCARGMRARLGSADAGAVFQEARRVHRDRGIRTATRAALGRRRAMPAMPTAATRWGCNVVELEVDPVTFEVTPLKVTAVAEIGKAIHPMMAIGQIEGGTAQGIGYALTRRSGDEGRPDGERARSRTTSSRRRRTRRRWISGSSRARTDTVRLERRVSARCRSTARRRR